MFPCFGQFKWILVGKSSKERFAWMIKDFLKDVVWTLALDVDLEFGTLYLVQDELQKFCLLDFIDLGNHFPFSCVCISFHFS